MKIIEARELTYEYKQYEENEAHLHAAIDGVNLEIHRGDFIAILGRNGSGKSTLAKHINALLLPTGGTLYVNGKDTLKEENLWEIRQTAGMVFQNPDNQIIGTIVEEDVGFGPENLGLPSQDIWERVVASLKTVGMWEYRSQSPNRLSGGQKQRVAIAGVVAMRPQCIVLDEPTAMLDPIGRKEVIDTICALNRDEGVTVILITHDMEEVIGADHVFVMDEGKIVMQGTPKAVFSEVETLQTLCLTVPQTTQLAYQLKQAGLQLPDGILRVEELVEHLCQLKKHA